MPPELTPDEIRGASFRTVLRGADQAEVERFLDGVAGLIESLEGERDRLAARLGEFAERDLKTEFESVGRDVAAVLESAREAAESMRERASADAARWRSESMAEAEHLRKEARNDAEALRGDAWTTGSDLLNQVVAEAKRIREAAERDAITITGEAEREAHRLVSGSRREAEDLLRNATMDAEKMTADAEKARDDMIESARREAMASQERTRALEQRREELMSELEGVRAALRQMEGTLEAKREDLNLSRNTDTSVRVIPGNRQPQPVPAPPGDWEPGETVRVIRGDEPEEPEPAAPGGTAETGIIDTVPIEELEPVEPVAAEEPAGEPASEAEPAKEPARPAPESDAIGSLFASLRGEADPDRAPGPDKEKKKQAPPPKPSSRPSSSRPPRSGDDLLETRDSALLPITNRALRGIKKGITEAQNIALDGLRTDTGWQPDRGAISDTVRADLITLWAEAYAAGHDRAESMVGERLKRPSTPSTDAPEKVSSDLVSDLSREMSSVGEGQRERQSAASKVFRAWRTDEAERRIRSLALLGFHRGLVESAPDREVEWVASGTLCSACRAAAADPVGTLPPVHAGCECTVAV